MYKNILFSLLTLVFLTSCFSLWHDTQWENISQWVWESQDRIQIFALGDSLTAWYGLPIEDAYPSVLQTLLDEHHANYRVINAWVSGNTSAELLWRLDWVMSEAGSWDIAILVIGWNDGLRGMNLWELESNILSIIDILRQKDMRIVLWGMQIPPNLWLRYTRDFEALYKNIARNNRDIYFIDFFLEWVVADPALNLSDMIHPNRLWYEIIAQNVYNFLASNWLVWSR